MRPNLGWTFSPCVWGSGNYFEVRVSFKLAAQNELSMGLSLALGTTCNLFIIFENPGETQGAKLLKFTQETAETFHQLYSFVPIPVLITVFQLLCHGNTVPHMTVIVPSIVLTKNNNSEKIKRLSKSRIPTSHAYSPNIQSPEPFTWIFHFHSCFQRLHRKAHPWTPPTLRHRQHQSNWLAIDPCLLGLRGKW